MFYMPISAAPVDHYLTPVEPFKQRYTDSIKIIFTRIHHDLLLLLHIHVVISVIV